MPEYEPTVWVNETPQTTPVKFKITDDTEGVLANSAKIELVTPVTPGTPLDATRMNKIEQGIEAVTDSDAQGVHRDVAGELSTLDAKTLVGDSDLLLIEDADDGGAKKRALAKDITPAKHRCKAVRTTAQSIPSASFWSITFQSADFDTADMLADPPSPYVVVPADGVYLIVGSALFAPSASGVIRSVRIAKNGTVVLARFVAAPISGGGVSTNIQVSCVTTLSKNEALSMQVYQDSGDSLDVLAIQGGPSLTVVRLA